MTLLQDLQRDTPPAMNRPIDVKPEGSKAERMAAQAAKIEAGQVHLPRDADLLSRLSEISSSPGGGPIRHRPPNP
jgi:hypothetical protein